MKSSAGYLNARVKTVAVLALASAAIALAAWLMFAACDQCPAFGQMMIKVADFTGAALSLLMIVILGVSVFEGCQTRLLNQTNEDEK